MLMRTRTAASMRVLILGGNGFIGSRIAELLRAQGASVLTASRSGGKDPGDFQLDVRDGKALTGALREVDAVVNAVAGSYGAIARGARALADAAQAAGIGQVVHLSSMAIYGRQRGLLDETEPPAPVQGWYARAKREAEAAMRTLAQGDIPVTILRPGCVWGPGSELWVGRIARWLATGRLGDLGPQGDGWTNGVHVNDVARAVAACLVTPPPRGLDGAAGRARTLNLASPESPRWNDYLRDLSLAIGAAPMRRKAAVGLWLDAWVAGPPLHLVRRLNEHGMTSRIAWGPGRRWPDAISPGLLRLWSQQLKLDANAAQSQLGLQWTPYATTLCESATWWLGRHG